MIRGLNLITTSQLLLEELIFLIFSSNILAGSRLGSQLNNARLKLGELRT